jgi:hypothetical protein
VRSSDLCIILIFNSDLNNQEYQVIFNKEVHYNA